MRIRTVAANILLPAVIAIAIVAAWVWWTGSATMSIPAVIGLALTAGAIAHLVEEAVHRLRVRRSRPRPRRGTHARPRPKTRKAAP